MPRKTGKLKANKTFLLVVEGYTEKIYFSDVKANAHIPGITVIPKVAKHSDLNTILRSALKEFACGAYDSVWCVFDRDTIAANGMSAELQKLYDEALLKGIHFADSMPAFEVWFLLHYAMPDFFYSNQDGLIKDLKKHIPDYSKNQEWLTSSALYAKLKPYFDDAMENSRNLNAKRGAKVDGKSTLCNVYKLFEELLKVASKNCNF